MSTANTVTVVDLFDSDRVLLSDGNVAVAYVDPIERVLHAEELEQLLQAISRTPGFETRKRKFPGGGVITVGADQLKSIGIDPEDFDLDQGERDIFQRIGHIILCVGPPHGLPQEERQERWADHLLVMRPHPGPETCVTRRDGAFMFSPLGVGLVVANHQLPGVAHWRGPDEKGAWHVYETSEILMNFYGVDLELVDRLDNEAQRGTNVEELARILLDPDGTA